MNEIDRAEWRWAAIRAAILVVAASLPYLIAWAAAPGDLVYTGFLSNPEDGQTYLAKMRQGWEGAWRFTLPYTPEPHRGEFLITAYLALGRLARWTGLPLIVVFHLARAVAGFLLLLAVYDAAACFFSDRAQRRFAFTLTALGSGFGWLALLAGRMTVDIWVPEGFVFYSLFVNPHFPLSIALMWLALRWSVTPWGGRRIEGRRLAGVAAAAAGLGLLQPFCLLTVGAVLLVYTLILWAQKRRLPWREVVSGLVFAAAGLPFVLNAYLATLRNPAFAAWSAQNQTLSPPPLDYVLGYGLVLILALPGIAAALRRRRDSDWLLVAWVGCTAALLYLPFSLQRRLVMGLILPLGALAARGWARLTRQRRPRTGLLWATVSLTNVVLIVVALFGVWTGHEALFVRQDERAAMDWLAEHAPPDALVIAAPSTGLLIPTYGGQRVFYGHPFETAHAELRARQLEAFYARGDRALLQEPVALEADYVFYGPRERALCDGAWAPDPAWRAVYENDTVALYQIAPGE